MNRIALKIKNARTKAGLTEKQLAKKCGLSASYIIQIESGKKIVNEKVADNILKSLGEKAEMLEDSSRKEENREKLKKHTAGLKTQERANRPVEPNAQWASALAGVLKKYPIVDCYSNKVVGHKELPIIANKVEGHNPDRIMFVRASNNDMEALRIEMGDVVTVMLTHEIQNNSMYLLEVENRRIIRQLRKENNKLRLSKGVIDESNPMIDLKSAKIIGKCIKIEFAL